MHHGSKQAWHVSILIHLHQCVQLAYMVLSNHPVLHIGLAESNAQASLHMHSNISLASTIERGDHSHQQ